jgi:hypothetical protein
MEVMKMKKPEVEHLEMKLWLVNVRYGEMPNIPPFDACKVKLSRQLPLFRILEAVHVEVLRDAASGLVGCERTLCINWGGNGCNLPKS